jgi:hypothetical protein
MGSDGKQRTTRDAAPRVYEFLKPGLTAQSERSHVSPAKDLWEAVEVWYRRRNITAHRGAFDPSDLNLTADDPARKTLQGQFPDEWLNRLRDLVTSAIQAQLNKQNNPK